MAKQKVIMASFNTPAEARMAIHELINSGIHRDHVGVLMNEQAKEQFARIDRNTKAPEGAAIGGATGVVIGALAAGLTAVATVIVPGLGFVAAGPIVAALAGAGAGGATGGAIGGLIGLGVTEHEAKNHTAVLKKGGVVVVVQTDDSTEQSTAKRVLDAMSTKTETAKGTTARASL